MGFTNFLLAIPVGYILFFAAKWFKEDVFAHREKIAFGFKLTFLVQLLIGIISIVALIIGGRIWFKTDEST